MGAEPSQRSRERIETQEDRTKEAVFEGNLDVPGTTDHLPQTKISCMGSPKDQAPVRSPVLLENGSPYSQETLTSYPHQGKNPTGRQTVPALSC